jgi:SAM-dependent methyltransferase
VNERTGRRVYQSGSRRLPSLGVPRSRSTRNAAPGTRNSERSEDWGTIARLYDLERPACRGPELAFWHRLASECGGEVLELAAGSGRVAIALARKGHRVTGLELAAGMLSRARQRTQHLPPEVAARLHWVRGDMTSFELPGRRFGLVFVAFNSFWLLQTPEAQAACLRAAARHLAPGGRLALDLFPPNEQDYEDETGIAERLRLPYRGRRVLRLKDYHYDPARRIATSDVRYYTAGQDDFTPATLLTTFRYRLRLAPPEEVQALLRATGYTVEATYGDYRREALTPDSPRAIFIARRDVDGALPTVGHQAGGRPLDAVDVLS